MTDEDNGTQYVASVNGMSFEFYLLFDDDGLKLRGEGIGERFMALEDAAVQFEEFLASTVFEHLDDEAAANKAHECRLKAFGMLYEMERANRPNDEAPGL